MKVFAFPFGNRQQKMQPLLMARLTVIFLFFFCPVSSWAQIHEDAKLTPSDGIDSGYFGYSVSLSSRRALIGAPSHDMSLVAGSAYLFLYDGDTDLWTEEARLDPSDGSAADLFGFDVSLDGRVALVGAPAADHNGDGSGAAYIYRLDEATGTWNEEARLLASNGAAGDMFGHSVALWRDMAVVGAPFSWSGMGTAYVFRYDHAAGVWQEEAILESAYNISTNDNFGWSVATTGQTILLGGPGYDEHWMLLDTGAAAAFYYDVNTGLWDEGYAIRPAAVYSESRVGHSLAIFGDATLLGTPWIDDWGIDAGAAFAFRYDAAFQYWREEETFVPPDIAAGDAFAWSLALFKDLAVVGAINDEIQGSAYTFRHQNGTWTYGDKLVASDISMYDAFGAAVDVVGEAILCGSPFEDQVAGDSGAVYVFGTPGEIEFHVPGDYSSIQAAIDVAPTVSCTILVAPGTYVQNIDFRGKEISVRSIDGPEVTEIDGSQAGPVVTFPVPCRRDSVIDGFTVTNGSAFMGGGIYCRQYTSPTITNNVIAGNSAEYGGGIMCERSDASIFGNAIEDNITTTRSGGGIYCTYSSPEILSNVIRGNSCASSNASGGGIFTYMGDPVICNNMITMNSAGSGGGMQICEDGDLVLINNTVTENTADHGGGIVFQSCSGSITNSIVWNNSAPTDPQIRCIGGGQHPTALCCDVEGGWPGTGNIDADPLFADFSVGDYHLNWDSPCRDSGDSTVPDLPAEDFEGDPRLANGAVDMGADEFHAHLYHIGDIVPGSLVDLKVTGEPALPVVLAVSSAPADPPLPTKHGDLCVAWPPLFSRPIGSVPGSGILVFPVGVPTGWSSGERYYLQALVGTWGVPGALLTNLEILTVE